MSIRDQIKHAAEALRQEAERTWGGLEDRDARAMAELLRPNLGSTPPSLRRVLEPLVAGAAFVALAALAGVSLAAFVALFVAAGLMYLIVTYVFGVELGFELPDRPW